jgi:hypothetical protein
MRTSTIYWIITAIVFLVSMIMSLTAHLSGGDTFIYLSWMANGIGWTLWLIGLICCVRGD